MGGVLSNNSRDSSVSRGLLEDVVDNDESESFERSETETESSNADSRQSDNSCLDSICDNIKEIGRTNGQLDELPLFNLNVG